MKRSLHKSITMFLSLVMFLSMMGTVKATEAPPHIHNDTCEYVENMEGVPCSHQHNEECGFTKNTEGIQCDMNCTDTNGDGVTDHVENCAYTPANNGSPCNHQHDVACGFSEAVNCQMDNTERTMERSVTVSTEAELNYATNNASSDPENPTIITVTTDIELNKGITISGNRSLVLQGETENTTIKFKGSVDDSMSLQYNMFFLDHGSNIDMTVRNIILDGNEKARLIMAGNSVNNSAINLTLETGSVLKRGFIASGNGGAIHLGSGSRLVMNDGLIIGNRSPGKGGAIYTWSDAIIEINGGTITNNTGSSGAIALYSGTLYLRGGNIIENISTETFGAIYVNKGAKLYLSGDATVKDNIYNKSSTQTNKVFRDIYLSHFESQVYIEKDLTGSLYFIDRVGNMNILPHKGYVITEDDVSHLGTNDQYKVLFLDSNSGKVKVTHAKTITFYANDSITSEPTVQKVPVSVSTGLKTNNFRRPGYVFTGWNTDIDGSGDAYVNGASVILKSDMNLYAQWKELAITFEDKIGDDAYTYDGVNKTITAVIESDENAEFTYSYAKRKESGSNYAPATQTAPSGVGFYMVTATLSGIAPASVIAYLEIKPAPLSVYAIKEATKYYDGNKRFKDVELVLDGIQGTDKISAKATATVSGFELGNYDSAMLSNVSLSGTRKDNYLFSLPTDSVSVENGKYLSIVNPTSPSKPDIEGSLSESGKKVKVEEVRTSKSMKDLLGNGNVILSIKIKEAKETVLVNINVGRKLSNKNVYIVQLNPNSNELELVSIANVDKKGNIQFETSSTEELTITKGLPIGLISTVGTVNTKPITYFMMENNEFKKGWLKTDSSDYYFFDYKSGEQQKNKWVADGIGNDGLVNWYSLSTDGKMYQSTWIAQDATGAKWYYVDSLGKMVSNTTVDGYIIDANGVWTK